MSRSPVVNDVIYHAIVNPGQKNNTMPSLISASPDYFLPVSRIHWIGIKYKCMCLIIILVTAHLQCHLLRVTCVGGSIESFNEYVLSLFELIP